MRRGIVLVLAVLVVVAGAGVAVARSTPALAAHGPTSVRGTEATAVFRTGSRTIRQIRYADQGTLVYRFVLANDGALPVTVTGVDPPVREPRLFRFVAITDTRGNEVFAVPAGERRTVEVSLLMQGCETLSARAGSFASEVRLHTQRAGLVRDVVTVAFPEEVHTGSPREASCPNATATSRPPG